MIKGWIENGEKKERVYDLACGDGSVPESGQSCPVVSAAVNATDCSWDNEAGAPELRSSWQDPDFDAAHNAFYYVRVVQMPTCRWTTYDSLRLGIEPPTDVPAMIQEMAWASPVWVTSSLSTSD